jgi:hypothetical protein
MLPQRLMVPGCMCRDAARLPPRHLLWVDRRGTHVAQIVAQPLELPRYPRLSPDGRRLALTTGPTTAGQIWIYDLAGSVQPLRLTHEDHNLFPI